MVLEITALDPATQRPKRIRLNVDSVVGMSLSGVPLFAAADSGAGIMHGRAGEQQFDIILAELGLASPQVVSIRGKK